MKHKPTAVQNSRFDVVVMAASAGGHAAIGTILRSLPASFSVPIITMMHLGAESTGTAEVSGHSPFATWLGSLQTCLEQRLHRREDHVKQGW